MSALTAAASLVADPDHHMFGIADGAGTGTRDISVPGSRWLGINPGYVLVDTAQDGFGVDLRIELWDGPPPAPPAGHELSQTITLDFPTGRLCVDQIHRGWVADVLQIPPGRYRVRLTAWDRDRVRCLYEEIGNRADWEADDPEFAALCAGAFGRERYLAQFWPVLDPGLKLEGRHG